MQLNVLILLIFMYLHMELKLYSGACAQDLQDMLIIVHFCNNY